VYDAAIAYQEEGTDLIILAGKEYGTGSSRDWAAKGTSLLGVRAVLAESFERIHRSNLVGMGVLPLVFTQGNSMETYNLQGDETYTLHLPKKLLPSMELSLHITRSDNSEQDVPVICRLDSPIEITYYQNGGILQYVLRSMLASQQLK
jgi:aconitate hydratase